MQLMSAVTLRLKSKINQINDCWQDWKPSNWQTSIHLSMVFYSNLIMQKSHFTKTTNTLEQYSGSMLNGVQYNSHNKEGIVFPRMLVRAVKNFLECQWEWHSFSWNAIVIDNLKLATTDMSMWYGCLHFRRS